MKGLSMVLVTPDTVADETVYCLKNKKHPGFKAKVEWYQEAYAEGTRLYILKDEAGQMLGFVEYSPGEKAWRPVLAPDYLFITCIFTYPKKNQHQGYGSLLIQQVLEDAEALGKAGVCTLTSNGPWIADNPLFLANDFEAIDEKERFLLLVHKRNPKAPDPVLIDWTLPRKALNGWHIVYANQCPFHAKAVADLSGEAEKQGIKLQVHQLDTPEAIREEAPSGFGTFSLVKDGALLEDHYISKTRFKNILKAEV
jgi:GNAT superfamily N-acetyltransferase